MPTAEIGVAAEPERRLLPTAGTPQPTIETVAAPRETARRQAARSIVHLRADALRSARHA
jgi:hypothetical protein